MSVKHFENLMAAPEASRSAPFWNARAEEFNRRTARFRDQPEDFMLQIAHRYEMVKPGDATLDLGCGTGRHVIHFAELGTQAYGIDISERMVELGQQNIAGLNLPNAQLARCDWPNEKPPFSTPSGKFQLVTMSMCPALDSLRALKTMNDLSEGWCMVSRFIREQDEMRQKLSDAAGRTMNLGAHNDVGYAYGLTNLIWLTGCVPQMVAEEKNEIVSDNVEGVAGRFNYAMSNWTDEEREKALTALHNHAQDGCLTWNRYRLRVIIFWKADPSEKLANTIAATLK